MAQIEAVTLTPAFDLSDEGVLAESVAQECIAAFEDEADGDGLTAANPLGSRTANVTFGDLDVTKNEVANLYRNFVNNGRTLLSQGTVSIAVLIAADIARIQFPESGITVEDVQAIRDGVQARNAAANGLNEATRDYLDGRIDATGFGNSISEWAGGGGGGGSGTIGVSLENVSIVAEGEIDAQVVVTNEGSTDELVDVTLTVNGESEARTGVSVPARGAAEATISVINLEPGEYDICAVI